MYEPVWINPRDAAKRGIKDGDIVKVFNERGVVLCGARVWESMMPGVVYIDHGARHDPIIHKVDRGGAINLIAPDGITSKNGVGQATSGLPGRCSESLPKEIPGMARKIPRHSTMLSREIMIRHPACALTAGLKEEWIIMKVFVIDVAICNGCYNCQIACKDEHVGNDWTPMPNPSRIPASSG